MAAKKPEGWKDKELPDSKETDPAEKDADPSRALKNPITTKHEPRVNESPGTPARRDPHRKPQG